jgi:hypothetical protein
VSTFSMAATLLEALGEALAGEVGDVVKVAAL